MKYESANDVILPLYYMSINLNINPISGIVLLIYQYVLLFFVKVDVLKYMSY
jgi:hypothetical protein